MTIDREALWLFAGLLGVMLLATVGGFVARDHTEEASARADIVYLADRIKGWWGVVLVVGVALIGGLLGTLLIFALLSFMALREYVTMQPTKRGDHRVLFWSFFIITPVQYLLIGLGWYGAFTVFIPVWAFILLPIRGVVAGDTDRFLERMASIQWGLLVCVFFVSHAPALMNLPIPTYEGQNIKLLFFLVFIVEGNDAMQFIWTRALSPRAANPERTRPHWLGVLFGFACSAFLGAMLSWATPFYMWQASLLALMVAVLGFFGVRTLGAIRKSNTTAGGLLQSRGSVLDRIDSLCFAAPVFFHVVRYGWT
jgi:phosphatidate cytidylyltransferase